MKSTLRYTAFFLKFCLKIVITETVLKENKTFVCRVNAVKLSNQIARNKNLGPFDKFFELPFIVVKLTDFIVFFMYGDFHENKETQMLSIVPLKQYSTNNEPNGT